RMPDVELALDALGVGVLGGVEAAVGVTQVAKDVSDGLGQDLDEARLSRELPGVEVGAPEHGLVVEHLLEVGYQPVGVDRIAGEPAAELVVYAARRHGVEGLGDHGQDLGSSALSRRPEQKLEARLLGELRGLSEPAPLRVVLA